MCCKRYHIIFSTFSLCKICVQKEVIYNFQNHILVKWPATNLLIFKMVRVWNWSKSLLFCLRYDPLVVFWSQNHITFVFIKTMSHDHLVQMAYDEGLVAVRLFSRQEERGKSKTHIPILLSTWLKWCWPSTPLSVRANIASSVVVVAMGSRLAIMTIIRTYYWNSSSFHCGPYTNMKILKSAKNKQTKMIKTSEKR